MTKKRRTTSGKRTRVSNRAGTFFAKRTKRGRFAEMDEMGRALKSDRRKKAKTAARSGHGDRGDRRA
jgi:hypothetical protein